MVRRKERRRECGLGGGAKERRKTIREEGMDLKGIYIVFEVI